jgi:hypothetical protein
MGWMPGFNSLQGQEIFLYSITPGPAVGPTAIQWVPGVNRPGCEADHSPPSSVEVKNGGAIPPLPHMPSWRDA